MSKRNRRNRRPTVDVDAAIEAQWARIPALDCKGKCHTTCGPIDMSVHEHQRIQDRHGVDIPVPPADLPLSSLPFTDCPALTMLKTCAVYQDRPSICRIWGATEDMPCIYGCQPIDGGPLLDTITAREIQAEVTYLGGLSPLAAGQLRRSTVFHRPPTGAEMRRVLEQNPIAVAEYKKTVAKGIAYDERRAREAQDGGA